MNELLFKFLLAVDTVTIDPNTGKVSGGGGFFGGTFQTIFGKITDFLIFLVGAVSIVMIVWGALLFVLSAGDPGRIKTARETILYSVVGIVVALSAFAIVSFVRGRFL